MKLIYLTEADVQFIYADLKTQGYFEWYFTLKCIEEIQCDYTFFSKITWKELLNNETIVDASGIKPKVYDIPESIQTLGVDIMDVLDVVDMGEKIVTTTAKELAAHLKTYESIRSYSQYSKFRIDYFRDYSVDINGVKTFAMKSVDNGEDKNELDKHSKYFLYIAEFGDRKMEERPEQYKFQLFDKKIGIAKIVGRRMDELSKDKRHGGTLSPLYVKALRGWYMPTTLCRKLERELHDYYEERNTGGEWFSDYNEDIIPYVEKRIKKLIKEGNPILKINITKDNEDVTFIEKVGKDFWDQVPDDFEPRVKFEL
jgi:hypothetical protein